MILGWIRFGDKAACGGTVCEGIPNNIRMGQPLAFVGAKIACKHGCIIATGLPNYRDNGRSIPHHMHTSSRGCPLYSTLNGVDGWEDGSDSAPAERCFKNADGEWAEVKEPAPHDAPFDEQPQLSAQAPEGTPYYIETMDGRTFSGTIGADGQFPRIDTFGEDEYAIYWGEEAINKAGGAA